MATKMISASIRKFWEYLPVLFMLYTRHYWWMYEIGVLLSIIMPLCQQYMCEEAPLSFFQRFFSPVLADFGYIMNPTCKYVEYHMKYRIYKYITVRTLKFFWKFGLQRKIPERFRSLFTWLLEFVTFFILVLLPMYDIYTCEEPPMGFIDGCLGWVLKDTGFVRQRVCPHMSYLGVLRRYAVFNCPRCVFKIWWMCWGRHIRFFRWEMRE